jgi:hypothetical protein
VIREHQEDDRQGEIVVVGRALLGLLAERRVRGAAGQQLRHDLLLVRDDDEEHAGRHPGRDHRAGMEKGGASVEELAEHEGGGEDVEKHRDPERQSFLPRGERQSPS